MTGRQGQDRSRLVSQRVVEAVAAETGTSPTDLEPLYSVLDPDALDDLFQDWSMAADRDNGHVAFTFAGCQVRVSHDGVVETSRIEGERGANVPDLSPDSSTKTPDFPD